MAANSSSPPVSLVYHCTNVESVLNVSMSFIIIHIFLLLPLSVFVLCLGLWQWRQQRSLATTSHSDVFAYHFAVMELIFALGITLCSCGEYLGVPELITVGFISVSIFIPGQMPFHVHLAVVHPVLYLRLRRSSGVRIRNVSIGCVWLTYCGWFAVAAMHMPNVPYIEMFCTLTFFLAVMSFCSVSVLRVLYRPGPGKTGGTRSRVDPTKRRAFHTITAVTLMLWLYFLGLIVSLAIDKSDLLSYGDSCLVLVCGSFYGLPSSLVLPLLLLQRAGKLVCCHRSRK